MMLIQINSVRSIVFSLLLSLICSCFPLNAGHGEKGKEKEESHTISLRVPNLEQQPTIENPQGVFYDELFQKWEEGTLHFIPHEYLESAFKQPDIKGKILTTMGYFQAYLDRQPNVASHLYDTVHRLAQAGHPIAQFNLGWMWSTGLGVPQRDDVKAFELLRSPATQNIRLAQYMLGKMCQEGLGTSKNETLALYFLEKAAVNGLPIAQFCLARYFNRKRQHEMAPFWLKHAIKNGYAPAQKFFQDLNHPIVELRQLFAWREKKYESEPEDEGIKSVRDLFYQLEKQTKRHQEFLNPRYYSIPENNYYSEWTRFKKLHDYLSKFEKEIIKILEPFLSTIPGFLTDFKITNVEDLIPYQGSHPVISRHIREHNNSSRIYYTYGEHNCEKANQFLSDCKSINWAEKIETAILIFHELEIKFTYPPVIFSLMNFERFDENVRMRNAEVSCPSEHWISQGKRFYEKEFADAHRNFLAQSLEQQEEEVKSEREMRLDKIRKQQQYLILAIKTISGILSPEATQKRTQEFLHYVGLTEKPVHIAE